MVAWFAVAMWPLQRAAMVPLLGIGFISLGGLVGSYSLARNATWLLIGNKAWEADAGCHRSGLYVGLSSSAAFFVLRELGFRPHIPPAPEVPQGASFLQMVSHAVHSMAHIVRFFPYRFRIVGVLAAGAFGGSLSVFTQKAYYNKWIKPAPVVTIVPEPASSGEIGSGAVSRSVVEEVKPVHTPKSVLPIQPPPTIEEVLPAELPPTSTLFDRVRRLADRESLKNTLPEVITDMSAYRYTVVDPVVSLDPSADEVGSSSNDAGLETAPTFHFEANVSEVLHRDGERPTTR